MTINNNNIFGFGTGIYTTPEVAKILGLPRTKVKRWLKDYWTTKFSSAGIQYSDGEGIEQVTNFHTLIEFFTFYQLRERGVSAQKIVAAHHILAEVFNTQYPFATSNILTDGEKVIFEGSVGEIIKADKSLQMYITQVIEPFCERIEFDKNSLADRFFPMGKKHGVVIDPKRKFGQPVVGETNILTETVFSLFRAGEPVDIIANLYDLEVNQVEDAINFHTRLAA